MPKVQCPEPGCRALVDHGRCPEHSRERVRGSAHNRGYDATWQRLRLLVLARDLYLCQACKRAGKLTPLNQSAPVDHVIPLRERRDLRLSMGNLEALCVDCHSLKTKSGK